jgi:hypothetical protein
MLDRIKHTKLTNYMSNNKHIVSYHSQIILASRPVVVLVHKILNPNFLQISIFFP